MNENYIKNQRIEKGFKYFFSTFGILTVALLLIITIYIFIAGVNPFITGKYKFIDFISGMNWNAKANNFGVLYMFLGTIFTTILACVIAIPISILTSIAISELLPPKLSTFVTVIIELLSSIPSIIYGMIGVITLLPLIAQIPFNPNSGGESLLVVSIVLAIMILPTIIVVSTAAIKAVPTHLKEASRGLGATNMQTIIKVVIPTAKSGIVAGIVLGIGRAVGETMAVVMVAGNAGGGFALTNINNFLFQSTRPLTANIAMNIGEATGLERQLLFSTALILFFFIFLLNIVVQYISKGGKNGKK